MPASKARAAPFGVAFFLLAARPLGREAARVQGGLSCPKPWPGFKRRLHASITFPLSLDHLDGEVARAREEGYLRGDVPDSECLLGFVSLRVASLLQFDGPESLDEAVAAIAEEWSAFQSVKWSVAVRSGWPVFQLLYHLQQRYAGLSGSEGPCDSAAPPDPYATLLHEHLEHRQGVASASLSAKSLSYLASSSPDSCPLTTAAAFGAIAFSRLPVYNEDTDALVDEVQAFVRRENLSTLLDARHLVLDVLRRIAVAYQIPSRHGPHGYMPPSMQERPASARSTGDCIIPWARTESDRCNFFAPIDHGLAVWRGRGGVQLDDVIRAFRPISDQKTVLFRKVGNDLVQIMPSHSHLDADFGATEPTCIAHALLDVLARVDLPDFDMVLNHGDLPILRRSPGKPPFYGPTDREARTPAPVFSICSSEDFWDILFPNVCRPALVNMSSMSAISWKAKREVAFWRGTDRGAVNWAIEISDMYHGSPRKRFLDSWADSELFDLAFLDDDLLNATVVNTDPSFVPLDQQPAWKYLLDLPGNGYSGSLKQKLTSTSAVVLVTDYFGEPGITPVYEHYHAGLQDRVHVLHTNLASAADSVSWARMNDEAVAAIVADANAYMAGFEELSRCYIWHLLESFARLLRYKPSRHATPFGAGLSVRTMRVHRRPVRREARAFKERCRELLEQQVA